jgi:hypothetical protein
MSESLAVLQPATALSGPPLPAGALSVPWRDPHAIPKTELAAYIGALEQACLDNPRSADLRTVLGMAHAVNYDVPKSMAALEVAVSLEPDNFWASLK